MESLDEPTPKPIRVPRPVGGAWEAAGFAVVVFRIYSHNTQGPPIVGGAGLSARPLAARQPQVRRAFVPAVSHGPQNARRGAALRQRFGRRP